MEAMDAELIATEPRGEGAAAEEAEAPHPTVLTPKEIGALARDVPPQWRALVLRELLRAMRWSEVVGLTLGSVDWKRRMLSVTETVVEVAGHLRREPTKTEAGRRTNHPARVRHGRPGGACGEVASGGTGSHLP